MAMRPIELSGAFPTVTPLQGPTRMQAPPTLRQPVAIRRPQRSGAVTDAIEAGATRPLVGGGMVEALARGGEAFFQARNARNERDASETERLQGADRENSRRYALANAVGSYDPSQPAQAQNDALIRALSTDAPEEAFGFMQSGIQTGMEREGRRSDYLFEQDETDRRAPLRGQTDTNIAVDRARQLAPIQMQVSRAGSGGNRAFRVLTPGEVAAQGLHPGSYQMNESTGQIMPIGRVRGQYTEFAGQSAQFASRMTAADATLRSLESTTDPVGVWAAMSGGGSTEQRQVRQAQREFTTAILRRESGAVISPSEFQSAAQQYFPQPGDSPEVIEQKRQARQRSIQGLVNTSQGAYDEWYGEGSGVADPTMNQRQGYASGAPAGDVIRYERGPDGRPRPVQ